MGISGGTYPPCPPFSTPLLLFLVGVHSGNSVDSARVYEMRYSNLVGENGGFWPSDRNIFFAYFIM